MLSSSRNSLIHNERAKLALTYNNLLQELISTEMSTVGCYTIGETIGEGTYGKVKKGVHKLTGKVVAVKKISKEHAPIMVREIHHHKQLKHPNIIMLYETVSTETSIHIISEYASNGDMLDALTESGGRCAEDRVIKWFHQLINAIDFCHTRGIVHRDLKLENILLDKNDNVKVCDFGFARFSQKNQLLETFCGSLCYSAPEIILRKKYTGPETDIWSLGVILYTLVSGEYPFDDDSEVITQRNIVQVNYQMPSYFSYELSNLIDSILKFEPSSRTSIAKIKIHPWYRQTEMQGSNVTSPLNENFRDLKPKNTICPSTDIPINFPHTESSTSTFSDDDRLISNNNQIPNRLSLPEFNYHSTMKSSLFRTSLPSNRSRIDSMVTPDKMSPCEKRLLNALNAAGFDRETLIKMQTGECDTSRTLWHLLLENMKDDPGGTSNLNLSNSVADNFAIAVENRLENKKSTTNDPQTNKYICRNRTINNENYMHRTVSPNTTSLDQSAKLYPIPVAPTSTDIQIIGFGSDEVAPEKNSWLSSIKSWFGASTSQQRKNKTPSCNTINDLEESTSSTLNLPNYNELNSQKVNTPDLPFMSPPVYKSGSQKYRRHKLQFHNHPIAEVDQLNYSRTSTSVNLAQNKNNYIEIKKRTEENKLEHNMPSQPPPTAECFSSSHADSFSLLAYSQTIEVDVCEKRYSMYRYQQPTPPPSPPMIEPYKNLISTTTHASEEEPNRCSEPDFTISNNVTDQKINHMEKISNRFKIGSSVRPRLALYGLQQQKHIHTKAIIEEGEEEGVDEVN